jgi:hypothetical protein
MVRERRTVHRFSGEWILEVFITKQPTEEKIHA